jgi:cell division protease FtsH
MTTENRLPPPPHAPRDDVSRPPGKPDKPGARPGRTPTGPLSRFPRISPIWLIVILLVISNFWTYWTDTRQIAPISYSTFKEWVAEGRVKDVLVSGDEIVGTLKEPAEGEKPRFRATRVDEDLVGILATHDVQVTGVVQDNFLSNVLWLVVPLVLMFFLWMFMMRKLADKQGLGGGGGIMGIGKSKARIYAEEGVKTTFADVAGVDEAKQELQEVIGFLKDPARYGRLGARLPKGILLVGPPGTGKTLLARAVAGEAAVPFFSISGSEFVEMFVGVGAARVRDLFEQARKKSPCLIFIDELDALGRARGIGPMSGGHDEKEQTLNQLLVELDGFDPSQAVVLLAATNRPEILDPALLRAGRFDRQILVDRPDKPARIQILAVHVTRLKFATDVDLEQVAALTPGFTGADLANLVNEAALLATRRGADSVSMQDFTAGMERIVAGLEKRNRLLNPHERRVTAYHEMGHALVGKALPGGDAVHKVSIIPRGIGSLGYTIQRPTEDRFLMSKQELLDKMTVLLGGRAAEHVVFGEVSTGAANDLARVTDIARSMVMRYGMDGKLGLVAWEEEPRSMLGGPGDFFGKRREFSEETAREIDVAVRDMVGTAFERAIGILVRHRAALEKGAKMLLEKETLLGEELPELTEPIDPVGPPAH